MHKILYLEWKATGATRGHGCCRARETFGQILRNEDLFFTLEIDKSLR